jgi:hypothetical protein
MVGGSAAEIVDRLRAQLEVAHAPEIGRDHLPTPTSAGSCGPCALDSINLGLPIMRRLWPVEHASAGNSGTSMRLGNLHSLVLGSCVGLLTLPPEYEQRRAIGATPAVGSLQRLSIQPGCNCSERLLTVTRRNA